jgi:hypothetical protein
MTLRLKNFKLLSVAFLAVSLFVASCEKDDFVPGEPPFASVTILHMEANNDLKAEALKALNGLEEGLAQSPNPNSLILTYIKDNNDYGYLLKISPDENKYNIASDTVRIFDANIPSDAIQINKVLTYIRDTYQTPKYNLILWSHGTAWAPAADYYPQPRVKSFGEDRGMQIDILDLKDALPMNFHCIIFDACAMASIEVLYEFRDKAQYVIASPTDILAEGFPYQSIVPYLTAGRGEEDLINIAAAYFDYYDKRSGLYRSASISVVDLSRLEELSSYINSIHDRNKLSLTTDEVQRLDFVYGFPVRLYDFESFIRRNYPLDYALHMLNLMERAVIYKNSTPAFLGNELTVFSGIAVSAPELSDP